MKTKKLNSILYFFLSANKTRNDIAEKEWIKEKIITLFRQVHSRDNCPKFFDCGSVIRKLFAYRIRTIGAQDR